MSQDSFCKINSLFRCDMQSFPSCRLDDLGHKIPKPFDFVHFLLSGGRERSFLSFARDA